MIEQDENFDMFPTSNGGSSYNGIPCPPKKPNTSKSETRNDYIANTRNPILLTTYSTSTPLLVNDLIKETGNDAVELLDELGPLRNEFQRRRECWTSIGPWWKGSKKSMDKGDFWPGCQPKDLPHGLIEGINKLNLQVESSPLLRTSEFSQNRTHQAVADLLHVYLTKTKSLFAQMPLGYLDKEEMKVPEPPQDLPFWKWTNVGADDDVTQSKTVHYGVDLEKVRYRRRYLLRLIKGMNTQQQAVIYVNRSSSVKWLCLWLKSQGLSVNALPHERYLMAHTHWILSEFSIKKFNILVMSDDHFDFNSSTEHFAAVSHIVHYELPRTNPLMNWRLRNRILKHSRTSPVVIITFFRKSSQDDSFKLLVENAQSISTNHTP